jgi:hypothetical protein
LLTLKSTNTHKEDEWERKKKTTVIIPAAAAAVDT